MEFDQNDTVWGLGSFEEDFQKHEGVFVENTHDKWDKKKMRNQEKWLRQHFSNKTIILP